MTEKITKEMVDKAIKEKRALWVQANSLDIAQDFKLECFKHGMKFRQALGQAMSLWLAVIKSEKKKKS